MLAIILVSYLMIVLDRHLDRDHRAAGDRPGFRLLVTWSRMWFEEEPTTRNPSPPDTILIPSGTQYGATQGNPQKRKQLRYAVFAAPCKPLQHLNYHS
jgi:hypothetical protein